MGRSSSWAVELERRSLSLAAELVLRSSSLVLSIGFLAAVAVRRIFFISSARRLSFVALPEGVRIGCGAAGPVVRSFVWAAERHS